MNKEEAIKDLKAVKSIVGGISLEMAIKAFEIIRDLENALPTICTTQFEAYAYHKIMELEEVDNNEMDKEAEQEVQTDVGLEEAEEDET